MASQALRSGAPAARISVRRWSYWQPNPAPGIPSGTRDRLFAPGIAEAARCRSDHHRHRSDRHLPACRGRRATPGIRIAIEPLMVCGNRYPTDRPAQVQMAGQMVLQYWTPKTACPFRMGNTNLQFATRQQIVARERACAGMEPVRNAPSAPSGQTKRTANHRHWRSTTDSGYRIRPGWRRPPRGGRL